MISEVTKYIFNHIEKAINKLEKIKIKKGSYFCSSLVILLFLIEKKAVSPPINIKKAVIYMTLLKEYTKAFLNN